MGKSLSVRLACVSAAALVTGLSLTGQASAGGFAVREGSAYYQGSGFAGVAAGGDASSLFWNPAASATLHGFNAEVSGTIISATADLTADYGALLTNYPALSRTTDVGTSAFVPASYGTYEISDRLSAGIAVNSQFGVTTKPDSQWVGSPIATTSRIRSLLFTPTIAYKVTPEFSIGVGAQVEYLHATLDSGIRDLDATGWGAGFTIGGIWQPYAGTSLGIGYRSQVNVDISGMYSNLTLAKVNPIIATGIEANASVDLPGELTFSGRQVLTDSFAALATVSWQQASSIGNIAAKSSYCTGSGLTGVCEHLDFAYRDQWYFALGGEYIYSPNMLLRAGVSYEISPVDDSNRNILIPDSNRLGVSVGGSYKWSDRLTFDAAYTHLFFDDAPFCMADAAHNGGTTRCLSTTPEPVKLIVGSADTSVDIFALGAKYSTGAPVAPLETYK